MMSGGQIIEQGTYNELMAKETGEFNRMITNFGAEEEKKSAGSADELRAAENKREVNKKGMEDVGDMTAKAGASKDIMQVEDKATGTVSGKVWWSYARAAGGVGFVVGMIGMLTLLQVCRVGNDLWLVWWSDDRFAGTFNMSGYVLVYAAWGLSQAISTYLFGVFFAFAGTRAARVLHSLAIERILKAPISFFDTTPLGRIINRFSKVGVNFVPIVQVNNFFLFIFQGSRRR